MVKGVRTIYSRALNEGFGSKFGVGYRVRYETPGEGRRMYQPKNCEYSKKAEDNSPNILRVKN